jgi:hypothetical protein
VWVAVDGNTGRQVAIKFFQHRGGLDWALLAREVEKLAFLSADRHVVQVLEVGWNAQPPYYVMEYVEGGSLETLVEQAGPLPVGEAVSIFWELATGLLHAHGKGVLHCDLKPANVLVDQDQRPRLADFGQARLSHEQTPALGTLFFMAPEQADLAAVPDVRWDVYALGALLYYLLTGEPPHREERLLTALAEEPDLEGRLRRYRERLLAGPAPAGHRQRRDVDRELAEIVDRSLAVDRERRYPNAQAVLDALARRSRRRARLPLLVLGAVGPAVLLAVVALWSWFALDAVVTNSDAALRARAQQGNRFAVQFAARAVTSELERRYRSVEQLARTRSLQQLLSTALGDPALGALRARLSDPELPEAERPALLASFLAHPARLAVQQQLEHLMRDERRPTAASWFVVDETGLQLARAPVSPTVGLNYGWRTYFHGGGEDRDPRWRPRPADAIRQTHLSNVFRSQATNRWNVAITTPVRPEAAEAGVLAVVGMTVEVGRFVQFEGGPSHFAVLIDQRAGQHQGLVLQHPLFDKLLEADGRLPDRFREYRLRREDLPTSDDRQARYVDPLGHDPQGHEYDRHWLAATAQVQVRDADSGWVVVVQQSYEAAIGQTLAELRRGLWLQGLLALGLVAAFSAALWVIVIRYLAEPTA